MSFNQTCCHLAYCWRVVGVFLTYCWCILDVLLPYSWRIAGVLLVYSRRTAACWHFSSLPFTQVSLTWTRRTLSGRISSTRSSTSFQTAWLRPKATWSTSSLSSPAPSSGPAPSSDTFPHQKPTDRDQLFFYGWTRQVGLLTSCGGEGRTDRHTHAHTHTHTHTQTVNRCKTLFTRCWWKCVEGPPDSTDYRLCFPSSLDLLFSPRHVICTHLSFFSEIFPFNPRRVLIATRLASVLANSCNGLLHNVHFHFWFACFSKTLLMTI